MPSTSIATTEVLSVSRVLPEGVVAYRNGLVLPDTLPKDQWIKIGAILTEMTASVMWLLGDWLAYGQSHYHGEEGFERIENGLYEKIAAETGFSEQRLRNAKWVASKVNLSRRRDKLTFCVAEEIVARATPNQYEYWIEKATNPGDAGRLPTVKQIREDLRKAKATYKPEPHDTGTTSTLAITDQYVRDMLALEPETFKSTLKQAHLRNLKPLLERLTG